MALYEYPSHPIRPVAPGEDGGLCSRGHCRAPATRIVETQRRGRCPARVTLRLCDDCTVRFAERHRICSQCGSALHWRNIHGIRLYREEGRRWVFDARCPTCNIDIEIKEPNRDAP